MDGDPPSRRPAALVLALAVGALVVGLAVWGALAYFGDDGSDDARPPASVSSPPGAGPGPTSALSPTATTPATATTTVPSAESNAPATADTPATPDATVPPADGSGLPGYDSEACALFRDLLGMVDDPSLRSAAAQVGCI